MDVLATPMLIALMEAASMDAVQAYLPEGWTTVGTKVDIEHRRATPAGGIIQATATLVKKEGSKLEFSVSASDQKGLVGQGRLQRRIVHLERFRKKAFETP